MFIHAQQVIFIYPSEVWKSFIDLLRIDRACIEREEGRGIVEWQKQ